MADLSQLLGRTLVLVAHPDDEAVGCGVLLQRMGAPVVLFATDGAPRNRTFWGQQESRLRYARTREEEARQALGLIGVADVEFLASQASGLEAFVDQELFLHLPQAFDSISALVRRLRPNALLAPAYEGGHPDHDSCSFLAAMVAREHGLPAWEFPLYHRNAKGEVVFQYFVVPDGNEAVIVATQEELERKRAMVAAYGSQGAILSKFEPQTERFRPQPAYSYSRPPHQGVLNYEAWQWPMTGAQLCAAFTQFLEMPRREPVQG